MLTLIMIKNVFSIKANILPFNFSSSGSCGLSVEISWFELFLFKICLNYDIDLVWAKSTKLDCVLSNLFKALADCIIP